MPKPGYNFPIPCDTCSFENCSGSGNICAKCRQYFNTHWKWINQKAQQLYRPPKPRREDVFYIAHPDEIRDYLRNNPCKTCKAEPDCDTPCPAYCRWWDTRMAYARKKVGF